MPANNLAEYVLLADLRQCRDRRRSRRRSSGRRPPTSTSTRRPMQAASELTHQQAGPEAQVAAGQGQRRRLERRPLFDVAGRPFVYVCILVVARNAQQKVPVVRMDVEPLADDVIARQLLPALRRQKKTFAARGTLTTALKF